jgi:hypothetical protein
MLIDGDESLPWEFDICDELSIGKLIRLSV